MGKSGDTVKSVCSLCGHTRTCVVFYVRSFFADTIVDEVLLFFIFKFEELDFPSVPSIRRRAEREQREAQDS